MTNKEKAQKITENDVCCVWNGGCPNVYHAAMEMAEWKDKQYAEAFAPILIELDELKHQIKSLLP